MTFTGNSVKSIRKQDLINSKVPSIGFKKTVFAHQASAGETGINLYALKKPSTSYMPVFNQPLVAELVNANLYTFAKNVTSALRFLFQPTFKSRTIGSMIVMLMVALLVKSLPYK